MGAVISTDLDDSEVLLDTQNESSYEQRGNFQQHQSQAAVPHVNSLNAGPGEGQVGFPDGEADPDEGPDNPVTFPASKGLRTMGLEALLVLPKMALAELFMPEDLPTTTILPRGPRAAAERVRQNRRPESRPLSTLHVSRYRALLLRERLQRRAFDKSTEACVFSRDGECDSAANEHSSSELAGGLFDFLSLSSLAVMDAGICMRPSWQELAAHVGTVGSMRQLLSQLQEEQRQVREKLMEARESLVVGQESSSGGPFASRSHRGNASRGIQGNARTKSNQQECKSADLTALQSGDERSNSEDSGNQAYQDQSETALEAVPVQKRRKAGQQRQKPSELHEAPLAAFLQTRGRREQELAHLEAECLELDEDINILEGACSELEALLRRVWMAERLPGGARIDQALFRRLWCYPEDDPQQIASGDKLFSLCLQRQLLRRTRAGDASCHGGSEPMRPSSGTAARCSSQQWLGFDELLEQLPPRALECLWCSAELRRKERQNYRYYWI